MVLHDCHDVLLGCRIFGADRFCLGLEGTGIGKLLTLGENSTRLGLVTFKLIDSRACGQVD